VLDRRGQGGVQQMLSLDPAVHPAVRGRIPTRTAGCP
jgi:hypothetical protein